MSEKYEVPELTESQRVTLIDYCKSRIDDSAEYSRAGMALRFALSELQNGWNQRAEAAEPHLDRHDAVATAWRISSPETGEFSFSPDRSVARRAALNGYEVTPLAGAGLAPEDWKMVPAEPTKEMIVAGQDKFEECIDSGFDSCEDGSTHEYSKISSDAPYLVYLAMLAAAPEVGK
ncbi:hypothetical protein [Pantoea sp. PGP6]